MKTAGLIFRATAAAALWAGLTAPLEAARIDASGGYTRERNFPLLIRETNSSLLQVVVNGWPMLMKTHDSYRVLTLSRGLNTITVSPYYTNRPNDYRKESTVTLFADVTPVALKIVHTWDTGDNYVDVYVKEPGGEECFFAHRNTRLGGRLDIGSDSVGYGPQIYTMPYVNPGVYEIFVKYYEGSASRLTEITTYVVLYEGTEKEKRWTYKAILTAPGERIAVGKVEIR